MRRAVLGLRRPLVLAGLACGSAASYCLFVPRAFASCSTPSLGSSSPSESLPSSGRASAGLVLPPPSLPASQECARRLVCVGDVHGCFQELELLLAKCNFDPEQDLLVLVGDLVGKGPMGYEVVRWAREHNVPTVMGNHDYFLVEHWRKGLHLDRIHSDSHRLCAQQMNAQDWQWLAARPYVLSLPTWNTLVVHAGVMQDVPWNKQDGYDLMNMRTITPSGAASAEGSAGPGWAGLWPGPFHVVFGHDAKRRLQLHTYATGLDTGCCFGGRLSALILPQQSIVSVKALKRYVEPESK
eukprot:gb/GEZN01009826.1/.p1 GENE.gb/GEZN01009826.1/~~gb/GEZN01009826.1/.p1  ORF type:complete len:297 (-),score=33.31 gb/GEZN01009826.1/:374-1264(-)